MELGLGKKVQIHSYKHDGSLHRVWSTTYIIEKVDNMLITANYKTRVTEKNGRGWFTKEPAICIFFSDLWFNVIAMIKEDGIHYYCNLSSPYLYDGEAIKYIDYDLDIKLLPSKRVLLLDRKEYLTHSEKMNYPLDVKNIIEKAVKQLKKMIKNNDIPFDSNFILKHYNTLSKLIPQIK